MYDDYDDYDDYDGQQLPYDSRAVDALEREQNRGWCCIGAVVLSFLFPPAAPFFIGAAILYAIFDQITHGENPFW